MAARACGAAGAIEAVAAATVNARLGRSVYLFHAQDAPASHPWALSLLPTAAAATADGAIFAWIRGSPAHASPPIDAASGRLEASALAGAIECGPFVEVMQRFIGASEEGRAALAYQLGGRASRVQNGWLELLDERAPFPNGRASDAADIIGMCRVARGILDVQSYEAMPTYRLVCPTGGPLCLPKRLHDGLVAHLRRHASRSQ